MPSWWDSAESVGAVASWLRLVTAALGILTGLATIAIVVTGNRIDWLRGEERRALSSRVDKTERATTRRVLPANRFAALVALLSPYPPSPVRIAAITGDAERRALADQLKTAFEQAGFAPGAIDGVTTSDAPIGVVLYAKSEEAGPPFAGPLQRFLEGADVGGAPGKIDASLTPGALRILVGYNPVLADP